MSEAADGGEVQPLSKSKPWTDDWDSRSAAEIQRIYDIAKTSLSSVQALTEYEDGKVARILTVVAFLSAIVGAVFTRFNTDYPWHRFGALVHITYGLFFTYVVFVALAAAVLIYAIRPTFNIPPEWRHPSESSRPKSIFFYSEILKVTSDKWRSTFVDLGKDGATPLIANAARNYVDEAYLIAGKIASKLAIVRCGFRALFLAMWVLVGFFVMYAITVATLQPAPTSATPSSTSLPSSNSHSGQQGQQNSAARTAPGASTPRISNVSAKPAAGKLSGATPGHSSIKAIGKPNLSNYNHHHATGIHRDC